MRGLSAAAPLLQGRLLAAANARSYAVGSFSFTSFQDAPAAAGSTAVKVAVKSSADKVDVSASVGSSTLASSYAPATSAALQYEQIALKDVARISVLHSSLLEHLLRLNSERFALLSQWPDFTKFFGKEYYYRAHPDAVRKLYDLSDEFHRIYEVTTEFESLSLLSSDLIAAYRAKRLNTVHPAVGPTVANGVVAQYLLSQK